MFAIDTGATEGGAKGPWISFTAKGSAAHGIRPESWKLRRKSEGGGSSTVAFDRMSGEGIILDIFASGGQLCGSLKLGHMKSGETMPERRWWPSALHSQPRPDESKSEGGGFAWRNALSVRVAIGGGETATWEDEGWGVYLGFSNMIQNLINPGFAANIGKCPHVRCIGYVKQGSGQKSTSIPQFEIVAWVDRPGALMEDAPQIASAPQPSAPVAAPAPRPSANEVDF
jgi:hypothetical protein